ncbi:MAG: glycosyltransferase [Acidobacteriota bacterium]
MVIELRDAVPPDIRVLHILHAFSAGGLENGLVNIINGSPKHLQHELCFLTEAGDFLNRLSRSVRYHELQKRPGNSLKVIKSLREIIRASQANAVHTRNWAAFDGVLAACGLPGLTVLHGEHGRDFSDPEGQNLRRNLLRYLFRFRVGRFIAVSQDLAHWLRFTVHIPQKRIVLIPNGVDTERFHPRRSPLLRRQLGIGEDECVVGSVGRLDPVKNFCGLIRAMARLSRRDRPTRLVIAGEGPDRSRIEQLLQQERLDPVPLLLGYRRDVAELYGLFDIFVLNSHAEGMSNTALEALASGLPVVATNVGGNPEIVQNGVCGCLVPVDDEGSLARAIQDYATDVDKRLRHGQGARQLALQRHSLHSMVRRYVELYESCARDALAP